MWAGAGAALALLIPILAGLAVAGPDYWRTMVAFSGTVNQGNYAEGWSLPWEYLWHSEGWLGPGSCWVWPPGVCWRAGPALHSDDRPGWGSLVPS